MGQIFKATTAAPAGIEGIFVAPGIVSASISLAFPASIRPEFPADYRESTLRGMIGRIVGGRRVLIRELIRTRL